MNVRIVAWLRETQADGEKCYQFIKKQMVNKTVLDFGCGIGGFLDCATRSASNVAGIELEKVLQTSFKKRGLNVFHSLTAAIEHGCKWDIITAFHVVEHISDPRCLLKELSLILGEGGEMIIEVPNSDDALLTLY